MVFNLGAPQCLGKDNRGSLNTTRRRLRGIFLRYYRHRFARRNSSFALIFNCRIFRQSLIVSSIAFTHVSLRKSASYINALLDLCCCSICTSLYAAFARLWISFLHLPYICACTRLIILGILSSVHVIAYEYTNKRADKRFSPRSFRHQWVIASKSWIF